MKTKYKTIHKRLISFIVATIMVLNLYTPVEIIKATAFETVSEQYEVLPKIIEPIPASIFTEERALTYVEKIDLIIDEICKTETYITPALVKSVIYYESRYNTFCYTSGCYGLMQISKKWHKERMARLGVNNLYDEKTNIQVGVDYLKELLIKYKDLKLVLLLYNNKHDTAFKLYKQGKTTTYVSSILNMTIRREQGEVFDATG